MKTGAWIVLAAAAAATVVGCVGLAGSGDPAHRAADEAFPSLAGATEWINTPPLTPAALRGKVVLVEFWTFTCVNWRRESPYVRAWARRYRDKGLVVIGVHSPEFEFEKDGAKVRRAVKDIGIDYPVAVDSRLAIWSAFGNAYWPALYFIDANGRVRASHFGEGDYEASERLLRRLLVQAGATDLGNEGGVAAPTGVEAAADLANLRSPETYVGYGRARGFASPGDLVPDRAHVYSAPAALRLDEWALAGDWIAREDAVVARAAPARVAYRFHARDVNLVMGPATPGAAPRFRVLVDGEPPGADRGADVDGAGLGSLTGSRLYQLIRQRGEITEHRFEIEFLDPGAAVFDFTFG